MDTPLQPMYDQKLPALARLMAGWNSHTRGLVRTRTSTARHLSPHVGNRGRGGSLAYKQSNSSMTQIPRLCYLRCRHTYSLRELLSYYRDLCMVVRKCWTGARGKCAHVVM